MLPILSWDLLFWNPSESHGLHPFQEDVAKRHNLFCCCTILPQPPDPRSLRARAQPLTWAALVRAYAGSLPLARSSRPARPRPGGCARARPDPTTAQDWARLLVEQRLHGRLRPSQPFTYDLEGRFHFAALSAPARRV